MNEQFTRQAQEFSRQAQEMFNAAKDTRIPENVQELAAQSVVKTRETYDKMRALATDGGKVLEDVMLSAQAGARAIGAKVLDNTVTNTDAVFDAALAIARAGTFPEAARLQANFMQQQLVIASEQAKELLELSTKVARQTFDSLNTATTKSFEQLKKVS